MAHPRPRTPAVLPLALVGLLLLPARPAAATFPGTNGRIALADWATGQIYAVNPDGTGLVQLTHTRPDRFAGDPSWSPDGTHIVFEKAARDRLLLWIMDADGGNKHVVADDRAGAFNFSPVYTPDGARIVYTRCRQYTDASTGERHFTCRIYSIAIDGTDRRGLTTTTPPLEVFDFEPTVSPDGTRIAFTRHNQNYDGIAGQIYVMVIDGSNPHAITDPEIEGWYPDWSPSGAQMAFTSNCCRPGSRLGYGLGSAGYVMNPDGSGVQQLTEPAHPHNDVHFTYSPDGQQMVFASDRAYEELCCNTDMFVMDADGSQQTLVQTGLPAPHDFSWGTAPPVVAMAVSAQKMTASEARARIRARCPALPKLIGAFVGCE